MIPLRDKSRMSYNHQAQWHVASNKAISAQPSALSKHSIGLRLLMAESCLLTALRATRHEPLVFSEPYGAFATAAIQA